MQIVINVNQAGILAAQVAVLVFTLIGYALTVRWVERKTVMDNWILENAAYVAAGIIWCMIGLFLGGCIK